MPFCPDSYKTWTATFQPGPENELPDACLHDHPPLPTFEISALPGLSILFSIPYGFFVTSVYISLSAFYIKI